jgi:hypothetical protein
MPLLLLVEPRSRLLGQCLVARQQNGKWLTDSSSYQRQVRDPEVGARAGALAEGASETHHAFNQFVSS